MPAAGSVLQGAYIAKGMGKEELVLRRERIAKNPGRAAAFEQGLAEGAMKARSWP